MIFKTLMPGKILIFITIFLLFLFKNSIAQVDAEYCSKSKTKYYEKTLSLLKTNYYSDTTIDVTYYKLNLSVDYNTKNIKGIVSVKAKSLKENLNSFYLDFYSNFKINRIISKGNNLNYSLTPLNQLIIYLDKNYSFNEEIDIEISYEGIPNISGGIGGSFVFDKTPYGQPVIWTLSQPYGAKDWFPCKDTPADKADSSDVWITVDSFFVSVSNGKLIEIVNNHDGTKTYKWKNSYPIANYLISLAMTNYYKYETPYEYESGKFLPVDHYIYPQNLLNYKSKLDLTNDMLRIFSQKFGQYPFLREKYGHAEFGFGGGMEHQTCTSLGAFVEDVIAHELAHQWFGDKVTCKDWHHIWLNEGFATYATNIYYEEKYGKEIFMSRINSMMSSAKNAIGSIYVQNINNVSEIFNHNRSYNKGAAVLHMLRGIIGDEKFFKTLQEYLSEPNLAYSVATTEDFQKIAERVSGFDLKYFFDEWIYGEGYPKYFYNWYYIAADNNKFILNLTITQKQNTKPQFFTMPIQIRVTTLANTFTFNLFNNSQTQQWQFEVDGKPIKVELDPENWILKDVIENLFPHSFILFQNYPNPFNSFTTITYQLPVDTFTKLKVYDILGREVATLINEYKEAGTYKVEFSAYEYKLSSGIYFYILSAEKYFIVKKMILTK